MTSDRELMQQALEALEAAEHLYHHVGLVVRRGEIEGVIAALRERLAQPETVMAEYKFQTYAAYKTDGEMKIGVVPEQEPVAWVAGNGTIVHSTTHPHLYTPLYTAPQRREWVGLTGDELADLTLDYAGHPVRLTEAIEAKLKEKNA
jgi:hypothetical protein